MKQDNPFDNIFKGIGDLYTEQRELAAIWLENPIMTVEGKTVRLAPDALVKVTDGKLIHLPEGEHPTHKVIMCLGTLVNQFQIVVIDLETNIPETIKI